MESKKKEVVILGGGYATLPCAKRLSSVKNLHVTLVDNKEVSKFDVLVKRKESDNLLRIPYDYLIIGTGIRFEFPIRVSTHMLQEERDVIIQQKSKEIAAANNILIIGGGPVGVELAGEIIHYYPNKKVTVVHAHPRLCHRLPKKASEYLEKYLREKGVTIILNERLIVNNETSPPQYSTSNGLLFMADMVWCCKGSTPNSEFMRQNFAETLDNRGYIKVDQFLMVKGHKNIFALGDVANLKNEKTAERAKINAEVVVKNMLRLSRGKGLKVKYETPKNIVIMLVSLGPENGATLAMGKLVHKGPAMGKFKTFMLRVISAVPKLDDDFPETKNSVPDSPTTNSISKVLVYYADVATGSATVNLLANAGYKVMAGVDTLPQNETATTNTSIKLQLNIEYVKLDFNDVDMMTQVWDNVHAVIVCASLTTNKEDLLKFVNYMSASVKLRVAVFPNLQWYKIGEGLFSNTIRHSNLHCDLLMQADNIASKQEFFVDTTTEKYYPIDAADVAAVALQIIQNPSSFSSNKEIIISGKTGYTAAEILDRILHHTSTTEFIGSVLPLDRSPKVVQANFGLPLCGGGPEFLYPIDRNLIGLDKWLQVNKAFFVKLDDDGASDLEEGLSLSPSWSPTMSSSSSSSSLSDSSFSLVAYENSLKSYVDVLSPVHSYTGVTTELNYEDIIEGELIAKGASGTVVKGAWKGHNIAIKKFGEENLNFDLNEFKRETFILGLLQHENLPVYYGSCTVPGYYMYATELLKCSLSDYLYDKTEEISFTTKLGIAIDIAAAMKFLHGLKFIHRDLKSGNIMLTENKRAKVIDFGTSKQVDDLQKTMTMNLGTSCWMAPELFKNELYNEKCDVYSFGIVLWEILTQQQPYANTPSWAIPVLVTKGGRPSIENFTDNLYAPFIKVMKLCWQGKALNRPSFKDIHKELCKQRLLLGGNSSRKVV